MSLFPFLGRTQAARTWPPRTQLVFAWWPRFDNMEHWKWLSPCWVRVRSTRPRAVSFALDSLAMPTPRYDQETFRKMMRADYALSVTENPHDASISVRVVKNRSGSQCPDRGARMAFAWLPCRDARQRWRWLESYWALDATTAIPFRLSSPPLVIRQW